MYFKYMKFGFLGIFANLIEILVQGFVFSNALNVEDPALILSFLRIQGMNMYVIMIHHDIIAAMYWYTVLIIMLIKTEKIKICLLRYCTTYDYQL